VYYLQGREVRCVNARTGARRALAEVPADHVTGFTHVSDDNTRLCVPTIHAAAFEDVRAIDATVQRLGLASHLRVFDTRSGALVREVVVERGWVTHVQFRPGDADAILFNHEWPGDCGARRLWLWDGRGIRRLRPEGPTANGMARRRADWVCHEVWSADGRHVFYHGVYAAGDSAFAGRAFIGRVEPSTGAAVELAFPPHFRRYGHFTVGRDGAFVSDGYAEYAGAVAARGWGGAWLSLLRVDWARGELDWVPLAPHGSSWESQDAHPHPVLDHAGTEVLFTSDREGKRAVYAVAL
jgi:oligogalacturonide lyase